MAADTGIPEIGGVPVGGTAEVARRTGHTKPHVTKLYTRRTRGFPPPAAELDCGPVWDMRHVEIWLAKERAAPDGTSP